MAAAAAAAAAAVVVPYALHQIPFDKFQIKNKTELRRRNENVISLFVNISVMCAIRRMVCKWK